MTDKLYVDAQQLLEDSFQLAADVIAGDFRPTMIVALWRGGVPMGVAIQDFLQYCGVETNHIAVRTSYYGKEKDSRQEQVAIYGLWYLIERCDAEDRLLLVDDVFDTGRTMQAVINELKTLARLNTPESISIAVPYYKPGRNQTSLTPDYYIHETEQWIKFPHSLEGLSKEEIREYRPELAAILDQARES